MRASSSSSSRASSSGAVLATAAVAATGLTVAYWYRQMQQARQDHPQQDEQIRKRSDNDTLSTDPTAVSTVLKERESPFKTLTEREQQQEEEMVKDLDHTSTKISPSSIPLAEIEVNERIGAKKPQLQRILSKGVITIVHGSMTGTCTKFAKQLHRSMVDEQQRQPVPRGVQVAAVDDFDWWDEFLNDESDENDDEDDVSTGKNENYASNSTRARRRQQEQLHQLPVLIVLVSTNHGGSWPTEATALETALKELMSDWRISQFPLADKLRVAIFGMGSSEYWEDNADAVQPATAAKKRSTSTMGLPAKEAARYFTKLGAKCITRVQIGDDAVGNHAEETFETWRADIFQRLERNNKNNNKQNSDWKKKNGNNNNTRKIKTITAGKDIGCCQTKENVGEPTSKDRGGGCCQNENSNGDRDANNVGRCCQSQSQNSGDNPADDNGCGCSQSPEQDDDDGGDFDDDEDYDDDTTDEEEQGEPEVIDLEDMGDTMASSLTKGGTKSKEPREMVTPRQAVALKKEGYRLIGTHSAVKLCRWTKHQLRGRGGCYKHTHYGITSYQCMEATPSLACANKCVFCWRHHKNPVGKEWRWKTDDPNYIVEQAVQQHIRMIKETKGIPGVRRDRWQDAHTVRHCALSLVGEPIMYPRINELLADLHCRKISSFLVTNGQHPQAIESLIPITQLYVSVDAPTETSLIEIDRPLFSDAWDRLKQSLVALKNKGQRTVARLTVVKGWNFDETAGYAKLVALGKVSLVEVKGVTFCGKSDASNLNMSNTPWHHEVVELTVKLRDELNKLRDKDSSLPEYALACEHKHSCSVLLARVDQFAVDDPVTGKRTWRTWIDYDKFHTLAMKHAADPTFTFAVEDYTAETPAWATFGSETEGFDPTDRRHRKKAKHPKYTQFDERGIPTHDDKGAPLDTTERSRLSALMEEKMKQLGSGSTITELRGGEKEIVDVSLMFRGLVVAK